MLKIISVSAVAIILTACSMSSNYKRSVNLLFQEKSAEKNQVIHVKRDKKLCGEDSAKQQECPISFYVDDFKAGTFYINNQANYNLYPNTYTLKVKNCTTKCDSHEIDIKIDDELTNREFILSVDKDGKPFIIHMDTLQSQ